MAGLSPIELELAELIIEALNLEELRAVDIDPEAPLFREGLGLDSIDALELALVIKQRYGIQIGADKQLNRNIFASLSALAHHIQDRRAPA